ncbi:MAG: sulfotransferase [Proteobacteria bacterium]|nr:sulfotransferase [Pseudomonadota bacterium]
MTVSTTDAITVVSGLPRSGTSLMMQMLHTGGLTALTDGLRAADDDNPRGYYELEAVKATERDPAWIERAAGHAVKVISYLLPQLPADREYRVVFMRRHLDEILSSQRRMLEHRGEPVGDESSMRDRFVRHLEDIETWLRGAVHMRVLFVNYNRLISHPAEQVGRVCDFLDGRVNVEPMVAVIDPALYRQRDRR